MFENYTCWDAAAAINILRPMALEGNEALFHATHSPISGLVITGTEAYGVQSPTEEGLLSDLSDTDRRHAMCVVEGEAGSGKSHLIRWLMVNWPSGSDLVLLIERADGTLEGTLRQLNEKLSKGVATRLESIVPRHKLTEQGQKDSLLLQLGNLCRSGSLSEAMGDEDWCEQHGLADMLQSEAIRKHWKAPERILEVLTSGTDRHSRVAQFTAHDVLELRQPLAGLRGKNVGPGAIRMAHSLREEAQAVASALQSRPPGTDEPDLSVVAPQTSKFLMALNSRLSLAIQSAMGISGAALQKMFRTLRSALRRDKRRLILLLEDITGAQGVDQELLYVLQEKSATHDEFCDIVSVVGITPSYFRQHITQGNVVQRITHHVRFGTSNGSFQAVGALEEPSEQVAFASRYLRAVRAGNTEIDDAFAEGRDVANRCVVCPYQKDCHSAFGEVDGVGLYPLNRNAIQRMFSALRDPNGVMLLQTPRGLLQGILAPSISAEQSIRAGRFPVPAIETDWHPQARREVHGLAHELIETSPDDQRDRLRATVAWWGEGGFPASGDLPDHWAGVPNGVFRAWRLTPPATQQPTATPTQGFEPKQVPASQRPTGKGDLPDSPSHTESPSKPKPSGRRSPTKRNTKEQYERLRVWHRTEKIEDDGFWRDRAEAFIRQLAWKNEDVPYYFATEALGEVRLQGSGKTDHRNVVIPCTAWAAKGLEWSVRLEYGELAANEHEFAAQRVRNFAQGVRRVVLKWIASRVPKIQDGTTWDFPATVVQVLLARAWLRGETYPHASLADQWKTILSDDSPTGAARRPAAVTWTRTVDQLAGDSVLHKRLRTLANCDDIIVNVAFAAPAIRSLVDEARFVPVPDNVPDQPTKTKWLTTLASSALIAKTALLELPLKEVKRLRERSAFVRQTVGPTDFSIYIERVAAAFETVRQTLPSHAPGDLSEWFRLYASQTGLLRNAPDSEHSRLQTFLERQPLADLLDHASIPVLLDHAISAPAESLDNIYYVVEKASDLVNALVNYLAEHESRAGELKDASDVTDFGNEVATRALKLREVLL